MQAQKLGEAGSGAMPVLESMLLVGDVGGSHQGWSSAQSESKWSSGQSQSKWSSAQS